MTFFLTTMPLWLSAVILIVPTTLLAMAGPVVVRRYVEVDQLRTNNEVAGFKFATVGVLYAVLLAFAVVVVWEKFKPGGRPGARSVHSRGHDRIPDVRDRKRLAGHGERHAKLHDY
jgi:predicted Rdx family selenoprotein